MASTTRIPKAEITRIYAIRNPHKLARLEEPTPLREVDKYTRCSVAMRGLNSRAMQQREARCLGTL